MYSWENKPWSTSTSCRFTWRSFKRLHASTVPHCWTLYFLRPVVTKTPSHQSQMKIIDYEIGLCFSERIMLLNPWPLSFVWRNVSMFLPLRATNSMICIILYTIVTSLQIVRDHVHRATRDALTRNNEFDRRPSIMHTSCLMQRKESDVGRSCKTRARVVRK